MQGGGRGGEGERKWDGKDGRERVSGREGGRTPLWSAPAGSDRGGN